MLFGKISLLDHFNHSTTVRIIATPNVANALFRFYSGTLSGDFCDANFKPN